MTNYTFTDALGYSSAQMAEMVNLTYEASYLTLKQTALEFARYCQYNSMDMGATLVMWDGGTLVGSSLLAIRGRRGWIGGFGIVPTYRSRGAGKMLLERQLEVASALEISQLQLEVPLASTAAIRLAKSSGFKVRRDVFDLLATASLFAPTDDSRIVEEVEAEASVDWLLEGAQPAWTRERVNLLVKGGTAITVTKPEGKTGLMYRRRGAQGEKIQLYAAVLGEHTRTADFRSLLGYAANGAQTISIHNEPEDTPLYQVCTSLGFTEEHRYHEMIKHL